MTVEILCVGTEILLGNIVNTNAAYLAEKVAELGLSCYYQSVVGDNEERLTECLRVATGRSDAIIVSGGLGPTEDDLTKEVASKVMGRELELHADSKKHIVEYFAKRGIEPTDNNWKQAMMPKDCMVLPNPNGTAPGVIMQDEKTRVILLPGPPVEMIPMFENHVVPYLKTLEPGTIYSQTVKVCGIGESKVETLLKDMIDQQTNPTIATYAKTGEVHIRVTDKAESEKEAKKVVKPVVKEIKTRLGEFVYTTDENITLEKSVVDLLLANELTITCAESCTGGLLSARLINVPGISECYKSGVITYSNKSKRKLLGVKKTTLQKHGAVSSKTAEEMVKGAVLATGADVAVSITGIAGPDGGTEDKPVGLVYISCNVKDSITTKEFVFSGNRQKVREASVSAALALIRRCILEYFSKKTFGKQ